MTQTVAEPSAPTPIRRAVGAVRNGNSAVVTLLAVLVALVIGGFLIALADEQVRTAMGYFFQVPGDTFRYAWEAISSAYAALFKGAILDPAALSSGSLTKILTPLSETLLDATPLIVAGLSVGLAFRAGLFNIGAQGQIIIGAICAGYVGFAVSMPQGLHIIMALIAGILGGAAWGGIAGWLKARTGAHEVITTIMLNYIAFFLLAYLLGLRGFQAPPYGQAISNNVDNSARLPHLLGGGLRLHFGFILALAAAAGAYWLLTRSTLGFQLRAVGANQFAARTAGMSVERSYLLVMLIAGGLAGLAGCSQILGTNRAITQDIDAGIGFDGITVALLGRADPRWTVLAGILFGALKAGGVQMQAQTGVPIDLVVVLQALIVLLIAAPKLIKEIFRLKEEPGGVSQQLREGVERMSATTVAEAEELDVIHREIVVPPIPTRRRIITGSLMVVVGMLAIFGLGLGAKHGHAVFGLSTSDVAKPAQLSVPAAGTAIALGVIVTLLGFFQLVRGFTRRAMPTVTGVALACLVAAFLCWAASGSTIPMLGLLQNTIFLAVPLILGALGGVLCERSGVINVAIEGQMLTGAFAAALFATVSHSLGVGTLAAVVAGGLIGAMLAVFAIRYQVNQVILGVVLNVFALGLTGFLYDALLQPHQDQFNSPGTFPTVAIPGLSSIPFFGPLLFDTNVLVYLTYVLVVVVDVALFRTRWGLRTRAVGEHPKAADTVGIKVLATRYRNTILGGCVAGLAGAYITIGTVGAFSKNISSGKGFIALAALIFGRWSPRGAVAAALLFGFADALQTELSIIQTPVQIPSAFLAMLPYLATIFAVAGLVGRVRAPAADGEPYVK